MEPVQRPALARRYLFGFEKERLRTFEDSKKPLTWLKSRLTTATAIEPLKLLKEVSAIRGRIIDVTQEGEPILGYVPIHLRIRLDSGNVASYTYSDDASPKQTDTFYRLGHARSGMIYPKAYEPTDPKRWLTGKRVRIATYRDEYGDLRRVIWVN